ncbi:MAG: TylF/MycF/NovP-related O-methyltransferase, partial [Pseudomonadota bacterium]
MKPFDPDEYPDFAEIWREARPYTMTSPERGFALYQAVVAALDNDVPGAFVECGVWRGGSAMIMAATLKRRNARRKLYLFDTYEGMTEPGERDVDFQGNTAADLMAGSKGDRVAELVVASADIDGVRAAVASTGYDMEDVVFVKGDVRETLGATETGSIALLRLDTDFYDSTLAELETLWPRLERSGLYIIDDYGHWKG